VSFNYFLVRTTALSLTFLAVSSIAGSAAGQSASGTANPAATAGRAPDDQTHYQPARFPKRAQMYYEGFWGVDSLIVRQVESGEMIRFSYRVLDPAKAKLLNDKKNEPSLVDPQAGVKLVVPSLEKVGQLRQSGTPEAGKTYWMAFSNKGRLVKKGDRVNIVIGSFQAIGLVVD
jgi:hypothetical protein